MERGGCCAISRVLVGFGADLLEFGVSVQLSLVSNRSNSNELSENIDPLSGVPPNGACPRSPDSSQASSSRNACAADVDPSSMTFNPPRNRSMA